MSITNRVIILHKKMQKIILARAKLILIFLPIIFSFSLAANAQTNSNISGLKLPRFVSVGSNPVNVRVGPGKKYEIAWIFVKSNIPVEIISEFDKWRKIRDFEGSEGWVHQSLLSSQRYGRITGEKNAKLYAKPSEKSKIRAQLAPSFLVKIKSCDGKWCKVAVKYKNDKGRQISINGYIEQKNIWGVYKGENFD